MSLPQTLPRAFVLPRIGMAVAVCVVLGLTGCLPAKNPETLRSNQLYLSDTYNQVHEFRFSRETTSFEPRELSRLDAFLSRAGVGASDVVSISALGPLASQRQTAVLDALGQRGVAAQVVADRLTTPDAVVILVERPQYLAGRCRPRDLPMPLDGQTLQLPGCANDYNLTRMVVDQQDLVHGKTLGPGDGEALARGIEAYRAGEVQQLEEESTTDN